MESTKGKKNYKVLEMKRKLTQSPSWRTTFAVGINEPNMHLRGMVPVKQQSWEGTGVWGGEFRVKAPCIFHVLNSIREILMRLRFGNLVY